MTVLFDPGSGDPGIEQHSHHIPILVWSRRGLMWGGFTSLVLQDLREASSAGAANPTAGLEPVGAAGQRLTPSLQRQRVLPVPINPVSQQAN